jgi:hypothetical protein
VENWSAGVIGAIVGGLVGSFLGMVFAQRIAFLAERGRRAATDLRTAKDALGAWQLTFERALIGVQAGRPPATYPDPHDELALMIDSLLSVREPRWRMALIVRNLLLFAGDETISVMKIGRYEQWERPSDGFGPLLVAKMLAWMKEDHETFGWIAQRSLRFTQLHDESNVDEIKNDLQRLRSCLEVSWREFRRRSSLADPILPQRLEDRMDEFLS